MFKLLSPKSAGLAAALALAAPGAVSAGELNVIATIAPIHSLAASVMQGVGEPKLLLQGGASAHTYAMKPSDAKALQDADIIVQVSETYETFLQKALKTLPQKAKIVTLATAPGMTLLPVRQGDGFEEHDHGHGHKHDHDHKHGHKHEAKGADKHGHGDATDVHIWLDPVNAAAIVDALADAFGKAAPAHASTFAANAVATKDKLAALDVEVRSMLEPVRGKPFIVFHDIVQYFEKRYGVSAVGSVTLTPERQPSAKRLAAVQAKVKALGAACAFAEPQFSSKVVEAITKATGARRGVLDEIGVGVEAGPGHYFEFIRANARNLRDCLSATS
ncbi:MAG: zinc ABC transporter substrate-binding protein [Hyphomicrobiales bacterium]|nr:zinc ABC transporter substrate-binding protein [Hyphomicrobiales bacterium]